MGKWQNFHIWRGRLPHWRADDVRYYATFRHRRDLDEVERNHLFRSLMAPHGRRMDLEILCILPDQTQLIFSVRHATTGAAYELSDIIEKAKTKAGKAIIKKSGERFPPFYSESYDRILRDDQEYEEFWEAIFNGPVNRELCESPEDYDAIWVLGAD